jgi:hypothetical protein
MAEQQEQLHMVVEHKEDDRDGKVGHQFFQCSMVQAEELPNNRAYLDRCSMVMAFKSRKYLENLRSVEHGIKINCNSGTMRTNQLGEHVTLKVWYIPKGIANVFLMHELEKKYWITYDSWLGCYVMHMMGGEVRLYKDKNGLPNIDLDELSEDATAMLVQLGMEKVMTALVQTVH